MTTFAVSVLAFLGGLAIGIIGMFLSDTRYLKNIKEIYEVRENRYEKIIDRQKKAIDRLIEVNNQYQVKGTREEA